MRIESLRLQSPDPAALRAFYQRAFDAKLADFGLMLGDERIEIGLCEDAGLDVFASNESGFQHFALVVADIAAAYAHLRACSGWRPISRAGPEHLPKSSGGASAFKFRDPDGHPLELLQFAAVPDIWRARFAAAPGRLFYGVDHTGLSVSDPEASREFFVNLGFVGAHEQLNVGPEQARLDGFADWRDAAVSILRLSPSDGGRPGVELLGYRQPPPLSKAARDGSAAATCIVIADPQGDSRPPRDPDGHRLNYTR